MVAVVVHLAALYWPTAVTSDVPDSDKVVHLLLFAVPTYAVGRLVPGPWWVVVLFAAHAPISELVQHLLLPNRSGDPWDAVADGAGVALAAAMLVVRGRTLRW